MSDDTALALARSHLHALNQGIDSDTGSVEELVALYRHFWPTLVAYAYHVVGTRRDAEDVVQQAFVKLFDQMARGVVVENTRAWMYRTVRNLALNVVRQERRRRLFAQVCPPIFVERARSVEETLIERDHMQELLRRLSRRERECLLLRMSGLRNSEVAEALSISAKAASLYIARALRKCTDLNCED